MRRKVWEETPGRQDREDRGLEAVQMKGGGRGAEKMKGHSFNRCDKNRIGNCTALMERSCLSLPLTPPESLGN